MTTGLRRALPVVGLLGALVVMIVLWRQATSTDKQAPPDAARAIDRGAVGGTSGETATRATGTGSGPSLPAAPIDAPPRARGVTFAAPGSLAKIPDRYEITPSGGSVFVNLAGGQSTHYAASTGRPSSPRRVAKGRVVDRADKPVPGAIALVATSFWLTGGDVMAAGGAITDDNGEFVIDQAPTDKPFAIALHATGWSELVEVGTAPVVLRMRGRGELHGRATYNGHGESFSITLTTRPPTPFRLDYETDPDGRYVIASVPPGDWHVRIALAQSIAGGVSKATERDVTITDGGKTAVDVAQTSAAMVVATPKLPDGYDVKMIEYWMFPGVAVPATIAAAKARAKAEGTPGVLYGGHDALNPTQFHDVAVGSYQICAIADRDALFACVAVAVLDGDPVREVDVRLVAPPK
jgi:hypothetical protein